MEIFISVTSLGAYPWELWNTRQDLVECIQSVLVDHVFPRHMIQHKDSGFYKKKSKFHADMSEDQVWDAIVDGISYPTYEFTAYNINNGGIKGYEIYKRLRIVYLIT